MPDTILVFEFVSAGGLPGHPDEATLRPMGAAMRDVQHARLLDKAQFRFLYPDAAHHDEVVAGLTKSLIAVRDPTSH